MKRKNKEGEKEGRKEVVIETYQNTLQKFRERKLKLSKVYIRSKGHVYLLYYIYKILIYLLVYLLEFFRKIEDKFLHTKNSLHPCIWV